MDNLSPKLLAAKYWNLLYPHVNFYSLKEEKIIQQTKAMTNFLSMLNEMDNSVDFHDPFKGGFIDGNGRNVGSGDKVSYRFSDQLATLNEALQDGDAYITYEDGTNACVKWINLAKVI